MINTNKKNIVVIGGSFNPPTIAHLHIASLAKEFTKAKKCIFLPVGDNYNKKGMIPSKHRLMMLQSVICTESGDCIETYEIKCTSTPTTYQSLSYIKHKYGEENNYYFVMGSDNLKDVSKWENANKLLDAFYLLTFKRANLDSVEIINQDPFLTKYAKKIITLNIANDIIQYTSSSLVRNMKTLEEARILIDPNVFDYIKRNKLYNFKDLDKDY